MSSNLEFSLMTMRRRFSYFATTALLASAVFAAPFLRAGPLDDPLFQELLGDVSQEAEQFAKDEGIERSKLDDFLNGWEKFRHNEVSQPPASEASLPWSGIWPAQGELKPGMIGRAGLQNYSCETPTEDKEHSIGDLPKYLKDRLGQSVYDLARSGKIDVHVFAGNPSTAPPSLVPPGSTATKIPSLYERWGISKFYVKPSSSTQRPRVVITIPPITQYAKHYAAMLSLVAPRTSKVSLSLVDRTKLQFEYRRRVQEMFAQLHGGPKNVVLGYAYRLPDVLKGEDSPLVLDGAPTKVQSADGKISGTLYTVADRQNPSLKTTLLAVESSLTLWGEATSFVAEAIVMNSSVEGFYFLGSAGNPSPLAKVYDVSLPKSFTLGAGKPVVTENSLLATAIADVLPDEEGQKVDVLLTANHTHTNSPAEQTLEYTSNVVAAGFDTLDVEQTLVADTIRKLISRGKKVRFGAANIVTDKPKTAAAAADTEHDLSNVDPARKDLARRTILKIVLYDIKRFDLKTSLRLTPCSQLRVANNR